jgi:hypothetical protein
MSEIIQYETGLSETVVTDADAVARFARIAEDNSKVLAEMLAEREK